MKSRWPAFERYYRRTADRLRGARSARLALSHVDANDHLLALLPPSCSPVKNLRPFRLLAVCFSSRPIYQAHRCRPTSLSSCRFRPSGESIRPRARTRPSSRPTRAASSASSPRRARCRRRLRSLGSAWTFTRRPRRCVDAFVAGKELSLARLARGASSRRSPPAVATDLARSLLVLAGVAAAECPLQTAGLSLGAGSGGEEDAREP